MQERSMCICLFQRLRPLASCLFSFFRWRLSPYTLPCACFFSVNQKGAEMSHNSTTTKKE